MLNDFYKLIIHMKSMYKNKIFIQSLFYLDMVRSILKMKIIKIWKNLKKIWKKNLKMLLKK